MKKLLTFLSLILILLLASLSLPNDAFAQAPPPPPTKPAQNPIDGGLALLAASGGAYAIKKLRDKRNH